MGLRLPRRAFLRMAAAAPLAAQGRKGATFPSEWRQYPDPTTELTVLRLTDPAASSYLPPPHQRAAAGNFLLFASDRTGSPQAFRMDLKNGECRQLTEAQALDPDSLTLHPNNRSFYYFDGPALMRVEMGNLRERELYRIPPEWERSPGFSVAADGRSAAIAERRRGASRLLILGTGRADAHSLVEAPEDISEPLIRPGHRRDVLYRRGGDVWLIGQDGRGNRKLALADGITGPAYWHPDGDTILYLNYPADKTQLHAIREHFPEENQDKLLARTSQFVSFTFNRNTSVFLGASRNAASPTLLLLLRMTRREFTICEHRASDPADVNMTFSPNSQTVFFQSDRHGKPAIYCMRVEPFVEQT